MRRGKIGLRSPVHECVCHGMTDVTETKAILLEFCLHQRSLLSFLTHADMNAGDSSQRHPPRVVSAWVSTVTPLGRHRAKTSPETKSTPDDGTPAHQALGLSSFCSTKRMAQFFGAPVTVTAHV